MKGHVKKYFLQWYENRLPDGKRISIEHHLQECQACQRYFATLKELLDPSIEEFSAELEIDPYLPQRIRAMATQKAPKQNEGVFDIIQLKNWGWLSWVILFALTIGIFIGRLTYFPHEDESQTVEAVFQQKMTVESELFDSGAWMEYATLNNEVGE